MRRREPLRDRPWLTFAMLWLPYGLLTLRFWFVEDDAYITFRYARNWVAGEGLRYNVGAHVPVEAYSSFLWVCICSVFETLGLDPTFWAPLFSFGCGSLLLWLVFDWLRRCELNPSVICLSTLFLGCSPAFAVWSTGGLETAAFALLLFLTFDRLVLREEGAAPVAAGLLGLAVALLRVEGIFWAGLLIPLAAASRWLRSQAAARPLLIYAAMVLLGYGFYFVVRYEYYELLWPTPVYAKVGLNAELLKRGGNYLCIQYLTLWAPLLIIPGVFSALRPERRAIGLPVMAMAGVPSAFAVAVGGDFMPMARLLVPGLAFNTILFAWLLEDTRWLSPRWRMATSGPAVLCVVLGLLPAFGLDLIPESLRARLHFRLNSTESRSEFEQWQWDKGQPERWARIGRTLAAYASRDDSLVAGAIGAVGYHSDMVVYDLYGLVTPEVARRPWRAPLRNSPGHDKEVPRLFYLAKQPTIPAVGVVLVPHAFADVARAIRRMAKGLLDPDYLGCERWPDACTDQDVESMTRLYVPDFTLLLKTRPADPEAYLVVLRRIEAGTDPAIAWDDFSARAQALVD